MLRVTGCSLLGREPWEAAFQRKAQLPCSAAGEAFPCCTLQARCEQPQAPRGSHLLPAAAAPEALACIVEVWNDQVYRTFLSPDL